MPDLHGRAATRKAEKLGQIDAWSVGPEGALWIATRDPEGMHLYRIESHDSAISELRITGAEEVFVTALYADTAGAVWIALADGRVARHQAGITDFVHAGGITQIVEDSVGNYYLVPAAFDQEDTSVLAIPRSERTSTVPKSFDSVCRT